MSEYCKNVCGLKVNTTKTNIVVFLKSKKGLKEKPTFTFENRELELVCRLSESQWIVMFFDYRKVNEHSPSQGSQPD